MANPISEIDLSPISQNAPFVRTGQISIAEIIATIFRIALPIAGALLLLLLLYAGVVYMTAAGNEEQTGKAKRIMTDAIVGLFIVVISYSIGIFIIGLLGISKNVSTPTIFNSTGQTTPTTGTPGASGGTSGPTTSPTITNNQVSVTPIIKNSQTGTEIKTATVQFKKSQIALNIQIFPRAEAGVLDSINNILKTTPTNSASPIDSATTTSNLATILTKSQKYDVTIQASGFKTCLLKNQSFSQNTQLSVSLIPSTATTGTCTSASSAITTGTTGGGGTVPATPATTDKVTLTALDKDTLSPVANVELSIKDQVIVNETYVMGKTNSNGVLQFTINEPGARQAIATQAQYPTCNVALYLVKGSTITLYLKKASQGSAGGCSASQSNPSQVTTSPTSKSTNPTLTVIDANRKGLANIRILIDSKEIGKTNSAGQISLAGITAASHDLWVEKTGTNTYCNQKVNYTQTSLLLTLTPNQAGGTCPVAVQ
jgi:hypothetical protein